MILTPEQIEEVNQRESTGWSEYLPGTSEGDPFRAILHDAWQKEQDFQNVRATLAAYAEVVQRVAESTTRIDWEGIAEGVIVPGQTAALARKLRGLE